MSLLNYPPNKEESVCLRRIGLRAFFGPLARNRERQVGAPCTAASDFKPLKAFLSHQIGGQEEDDDRHLRRGLTLSKIRSRSAIYPIITEPTKHGTFGGRLPLRSAGELRFSQPSSVIEMRP